MDVNCLFDVVRQKALSDLPTCQKIVAHLDDTVIVNAEEKYLALHGGEIL
jgi:hypothetical protein